MNAEDEHAAAHVRGACVDSWLLQWRSIACSGIRSNCEQMDADGRPTRRVRVKGSPKPVPKTRMLATAVKSAAKPAEPAKITAKAADKDETVRHADMVTKLADTWAALPHVSGKCKAEPAETAVEDETTASIIPEDVTWGPEYHKKLVRLLAEWPRRLWDVFVRFRKSVQHARGRDREHFKMAAELVRDNKRCRTADWSSDATLASTTSAAADIDDDEEERQMILKGALDKMSEFSMSTSFSGIDAPGTAFLSLGLGLCQSLGLSPEHMPRPRNSFAIEWLSCSQQELLRHPHAADHIFADISEFYQPALRRKLDTIVAEDKIQTLLVPMVQSGKAMVKQAWCLRHQRMCEAGMCIRLQCLLELLELWRV